MTFLKNVWYVAAWADEIAAGAMLARKIANEGVVLFREPSGAAVALNDRCPHRFAPLHLGRLRDGVVECGYHGLQFDGRGTCVFNPHGEGQIPPNAKVKAYPLEERHQALWIWMGEPDQADPALIPDFSMVIDGRTAIVRGYLQAPSNYEFMADNLLDLGHTAYLHPTTLGSEAIVHSTRTTRRDGDKVIYELWAPRGRRANGDTDDAATIPRPEGRPLDGKHLDRPGLIHQLTGTAPAGANKQGGVVSNGLHWLTPETETTTHYFQALSRTFRLDDPELDQLIQMGVIQAFTQEDFPMVGAIQREVGEADIADLKPVILSIDAGGVLARNILRQKLQGELAATRD